MQNMVEIFIPLLEDDEGISRPTQALHLGGNMYKVFATPHYDPTDEVWQFLPNTVVIGKEVTDINGTYLLAIEKFG